MDREWEKFRGGPFTAFRDRVHVTLTGRGQIFINANMHRIMGKPSAVYLFFNRSKDQIALEPASARLPESFPVVDKCTGFMINAGPFCRHFGIHLDRTHKFVRPDLDTDGRLLLDLSNIVNVALAKPRKRRK